MNAPRFFIPGSSPSAASSTSTEPAPAALSQARSVAEVLAQTQVQSVLQELDEELVGLASVKARIHDIAALLVVDKLRLNFGLAAQAPSLHMCFTGNPGTGKTTVARLMAKVFHGLGLLPTDRVIEVTRNELVSAFRADTPKLTNKAIDNAMGGVLFIDEAYSLLPPGTTGDPGIEAINTLLKRMEDERGKFVVIAAGYHREMQVFLDSNSGLRSRFSDLIDFADYNAAEMQRIFELLCQQDQLQRAPGFDAQLAEHLQTVFAHRDASFANGRTVRQLFNAICAACGERVSRLGLPPSEQPAAMRLLTTADLPQVHPGVPA